jgi:hypothetical protein
VEAKIFWLALLIGAGLGASLVLLVTYFTVYARLKRLERRMRRYWTGHARTDVQLLGRVSDLSSPPEEKRRRNRKVR